MAMDALGGDETGESVDRAARATRTARVRGFLHFVPTYGRAAVSLSFMRRDREAPNGLTEFLVVRAVEMLGERGIEELSLNFVAFGQLLERPARTRRRRCSAGSSCSAAAISRWTASTASAPSSRLGGSLGTSSSRACSASPAPASPRMWAEGQLPRLRSG